MNTTRKPRPDAAMVASGYERTPHDFYATIDARCVEYLDKVWPLTGTPFVEPCAGQGHLVEALVAHGAICESASDLHVYPPDEQVTLPCRIQTGIDIFVQPPQGPVTIITNPPNDQQMLVTRHLLASCPHAWIILLMRSTQLHVKSMRELMRGRFYGVAPLPFRPIWFTTNKDRPRHEYSWFLWRPAHFRANPPRVMIHHPEEPT